MAKEGDDDWGTISELYTFARRSALSIDIAIQEMITEINKFEAKNFAVMEYFSNIFQNKWRITYSRLIALKPG
jgi:hypothetical protein